MSEYFLANDLIVWCKNVLGLKCEITKNDNEYFIYLNGNLTCKFEARSLEGFRLGLTRFKLEISELFVA